MLIAAFFVGFSLFVGFSRFGDIKLGKDQDEPEFSTGSWFALLFAAGMGIGLVFYGVSEPLSHFASPRPGVTGTEKELAQQALTQTFLHWGLHAWAIYVVLGLGPGLRDPPPGSSGVDPLGPRTAARQPRRAAAGAT